MKCWKFNPIIKVKIKKKLCVCVCVCTKYRNEVLYNKTLRYCKF